MRSWTRNNQVQGKWAQPGVPRKGWTCVGVHDLEDERQTCEMCEGKEIRYVHAMEHHDYPVTLFVGCMCAGHMEADYEGAKRREQEVRNTASRKARWLSMRWKTSAKGNQYIKTRDKFHVVVFPTVDRLQWCARVEDTTTRAAIFSRRTYPTEPAAKLAAFDALIALKSRRATR